jgi:C-terminal processing protease CtpA/Prc
LAGAFTRYWAQFDSTYTYFDYKRVDWTALRAQFAAQATSAPTYDALVEVLRTMVGPLRDGHVKFITPSGVTLMTWQNPRASNWDAATWRAYAARANWVQVARDLGYGSFGDVGYIAIGSWNSAAFDVAQLDSVLEHVRNYSALIIDVRPNEGGDDALALPMAARFIREETITEYTQHRAGPSHSDMSPLTARRVSPRGPWRYDKPVLLLIGSASASSNESFVAAMKTAPQVTTLGDTTAGSSGNPRQFSLGGGWSFTVPQWIAYTRDMRVIEWNGIAPDIVVPFRPESWALLRDDVLDEAIRRGCILTGASVC